MESTEKDCAFAVCYDLKAAIALRDYLVALQIYADAAYELCADKKPNEGN